MAGVIVSAEAAQMKSFGWLAIMAAVLATAIILVFVPVGLFGVATDCAVASDLGLCRFWKITILGAPLLLIVVWLLALGFFRKRGRIYWATTSLVIGGYVIFLLLA
jgi:hypothetical protein